MPEEPEPYTQIMQEHLRNRKLSELEINELDGLIEHFVRMSGPRGIKDLPDPDLAFLGRLKLARIVREELKEDLSAVSNQNIRAVWEAFKAWKKHISGYDARWVEDFKTQMKNYEMEWKALQRWHIIYKCWEDNFIYENSLFKSDFSTHRWEGCCCFWLGK